MKRTIKHRVSRKMIEDNQAKAATKVLKELTKLLHANDQIQITIRAGAGTVTSFGQLPDQKPVKWKEDEKGNFVPITTS